MVALKGSLLACVLLLNISTAFSNPFKIYRRHSLPGGDRDAGRQGRNSKLMSFDLLPPVKAGSAAPLAIKTEDKKTDLEAELEDLAKKSAQIKAELAEVTSETADVKEKTVEVKAETADVKEKTVELLEDAKDGQKDAETIKAEGEELTAEAEDLKEKSEDLKAEAADLIEKSEQLIEDPSLLELEAAVTDVLVNDVLNEEINAEDRAGKQGEDILGLTADQAEFSDYSNNNNKRQVPKVTRPGSNKPVFQLRQAGPATFQYEHEFDGQYNPPQQQYNNGQQYNSNQQYNQYNNNNNYQQQQGANNRRQYGNAQPRSGLDNNFGPNMGDQLVAADPENNAFVAQPQLGVQRQAAAAAAADAADATDAADAAAPAAAAAVDTEDGVRCINKVMQVEETVYDNVEKCQHSFSEKCHDTYITDYVATQEDKCETSFKKNCHITYQPMMFKEKVTVCNEPLEKKCSDDYQGPNICKTHYETICETRYKEHEVEQDEPVCEMVIEKRCDNVRVPIASGNEVTRRRRQADFNNLINNGQFSNIDGNDLNEFALRQFDDSVSVGEECEDWPVQKCTLEKKTVTKSNPITDCRKVSKQICAPDNCQFVKAAKQCRDEVKNLLQNIPSEQCDLEPQENCKKETVLVPKLVRQANCIKVPKEVCVMAKTNPKKVMKPVIKQWCYNPSDLADPTSRSVLRQYLKN